MLDTPVGYTLPKTADEEGTGAAAAVAVGAGEAASAADTDTPLQYLGELIVTAEATTADVKQLIAATFPTVTVEGSGAVIELQASKLRVRELIQQRISITATAKRLGKVLIDSNSLATTMKPVKLTDGKAFAVQTTALPEAFEAGDMLVNLRVSSHDALGM